MKSKIITFDETVDVKANEGIFSYLQEQAKYVNLHEKGIVSLTTNSPGAKSKPLHLIDKNNTYWASNDNIDAYLLIDFKQNKVIISDYWIDDCGFDFPREWKMLGSNNKIKWTLISHEKTNFAENDSQRYCLRFHSTSLGRFRYIKIMQMSKRGLSGSFLVFYDIELFGVFCSYNDVKNDIRTCALNERERGPKILTL